MPRALMRMSLAHQIFLVNVLVLGTAALLLLVAPVTISAPIGIGEAAIVIGGLALILATVGIGLRRLLGPLERLGDAMREVDPRDPDPDLRRFVAPDDRDVSRLLEAFEQMLDRFRTERLESDRRMVATQDAERRRIARELHDELGQTLTALSLQIERAGIDDTAREPIARTVARALDDVRGIARRLRPEALDDLGLVNALIALVTRVSEESGLPIERRLESPVPELPPDAELTLYRVAQEALTNAIRHADATHATVTLRIVDGTVIVTVSDDGHGFVTRPPASGGLAGMHERARLVGARVDVRSDAGRGTDVQITLPPTEVAA
jgi:two-component system sensor histidine kinase UhpB